MTMNSLPRLHRRALPVVLIFLFAALIAATAGKAAADPAGMDATGQQTTPAIRRTGLLPPSIVLFEERAGTGGSPQPRADWSSPAVSAVSSAFIAELAARQMEPAVVIRPDELDPADLSGLYSVPDLVSRDDGHQFPESLLSADYPAASVAAVMQRHRLDAVWVVSGIAILPGGGTASSGPAAATEKMTADRKRLLLRLALLDGQGKVLYSDVVDSSAAAAKEAPLPVDLRDPQAARRSVGALLAEFRTEQEKKSAAQAIVRAQEMKAAEQRERERAVRAGPPELRVGLGILFLATDGVDLLVSYRPAGSSWQLGYRYVRYTDALNDPIIYAELTRTTDTMQGPQVNYLFRPEETTSWYLGISVLKWSRTEVSTVTGASDSASVTAPFFGGGWTAHLGKHAYFNIGIFLSPGAELKTDTGVSSEESSGGFDIQLQLGLVF
jgi:hypothetical protein